METIYKIKEESTVDEVIDVLKVLPDREQEAIMNTLRGFLMVRQFAAEQAAGGSGVQYAV